MQLGIGPRFFTRRRGPPPVPAIPYHVRDDVAFDIAGGSGWHGQAYAGVSRQNGLAMLARFQLADVQAGSEGLTNAPFAVGLFPAANPADPLAGGHALSISQNNMSAARLGAVGQAHGEVLRRFKQLEADAIVIGRDRGGIVYGASFAGVRGLGSRPTMRPLALDGARTDATLYPGIYTRASGVHVEEVAVRVLEEYPDWFLTAHAADELIGSGGLLGTEAEVGGVWAGTGSYVRTSTGAQRTGASGANIDPGVASGLIAAEFAFTTATSGHEIQFARLNGSNYSFIQLNATGIAFIQVVNGAATTIQTAPIPSVANRTVRVEAHINGQVVTCRVDGVVPSNIAPVTYPTAFASTRVGFYINDLNGPTRVRRFEAHPASIPIPATLRLKAPLEAKAAPSVAFSEPFDGSGALPAPYVRTRGTATASLSGGSVGISGATTEDTHYTRTLAAAYVDALLNFTPPGAAMGDGAGCMATIVVEGVGALLASEPLGLRAFIRDEQIGNTELEAMGYLPGTPTPENPNPPPEYRIINRVAMALELQKGVAQSIRLLSDGERYVGYFGTEPVISGRHAVATERVGIGAGTGDTGSRFNTLEVRT